MLPLSDQNLPGRGIAWVTVAFVVVNVAAFVLLQLGPDGDAFTYGYSAVPAEITSGMDLTEPQTITVDGQRITIPQEPGPIPIYLTLLTSMFMHGGWLHLAGNMLFLWIFGDNVEHTFGPLLYLPFYLVSGVAGSLAQIWLAPESPIPTLGASGAISGVLGAYLVLFPQNRVLVFLFRFLVYVPAIVAIGMWAALQFLLGFASIAETQQTGGVAYMAHVGGFLVGVVAGLVYRAGRGRQPPFRYAT